MRPPSLAAPAAACQGTHRLTPLSVPAKTQPRAQTHKTDRRDWTGSDDSQKSVHPGSPRPFPGPARSRPGACPERLTVWSWAARVREKGLSTCDPSSMNQPASLPHSLTRRPTPSRHRLWTTQQLACPQVASSRLAAARPASATLSTSLATASKTTSSDCSPAEISRDHPSSPEITRDHPRSPSMGPRCSASRRDYPRLPEITRD